jgi:hypothetical protein
MNSQDLKHLLNGASYLFPRYKRVYDKTQAAFKSVLDETVEDRKAIARDFENITNDVRNAINKLAKKNVAK